MFGINSTLNLILTRINDFRTFITKKLDIMSGVNNNTEGILKKNLAISKETLEKVNGISVKVVEIFQILNTGVEEDHSGFFFSKFKIENITIEGRLEKITMNEFQFVTVTLEGVKKNGKPATWQGEPVAETDHPEMVEVKVLDNKTIEFHGIEDSVHEPTAVTCTAKVDADLGEGVEEQIATGILVIEPGRLTGLSMKFSEPQDRPDANPTPVEE